MRICGEKGKVNKKGWKKMNREEAWKKRRGTYVLLLQFSLYRYPLLSMHLPNVDVIILVVIKLLLCKVSVFVVIIFYTRGTASVWVLSWFNGLRQRTVPVGEMYEAHMYFSLWEYMLWILQVKQLLKWMGVVNEHHVLGIAWWILSRFFS